MDWIDQIFGEKPKNKERTNNPLEKLGSELKLGKGGNIEIHNHFHTSPEPRRVINQFQGERKQGCILSALESFDRDGHKLNPMTLKPDFTYFKDSDGDGVPDVIDPAPRDPSIPVPLTKQLKNKKVDNILKEIFGGYNGND